jgi:hypothetical protein
MQAARRWVWSVLAWPVESQLGSRRNALVASTALTQQRLERDQVEAFLATRAWPTASSSASTGGVAPRRDVI